MTSRDVLRGVRTIRQVEGFALVPALLPLLAAGEPVAIEELARASGRSVDEVAGTIAEQPSTEWDEDGRIVGFGLTLRPTPHRFTFQESTVYGWCASDLLVFPVLLDTAGVAESTCPSTGRAITVTLGPDGVRAVDPPDAVVSEVRPEAPVDDVRSDICGLGHFFSSRDAAADWIAAHPDGQVHSVEDDFALHRDVMAELGWTATAVS